MEKTFDMKVMEGKKEIIETVNNLKLPLTVISMLLHDINTSVDLQLDRELNEQAAALNSAEEKRLENDV